MTKVNSYLTRNIYYRGVGTNQMTHFSLERNKSKGPFSSLTKQMDLFLVQMNKWKGPFFSEEEQIKRTFFTPEEQIKRTFLLQRNKSNGIFWSREEQIKWTFFKKVILDIFNSYFIWKNIENVPHTRRLRSRDFHSHVIISILLFIFF